MKMKGLSTHELLVAFSAVQSMALVAIHYPQREKRHMALQDVLAHALREEGHEHAADEVARGCVFLVFDDVHDAINVARCVRSHSAEVSADLYSKGQQNEEVLAAEELLKLEKERRHVLHNPKFTVSTARNGSAHRS